jgi:hypothetical protein
MNLMSNLHFNVVLDADADEELEWDVVGRNKQ